MGTLRTLTWTWHSAEGQSHTVWLPDCAGQDIRHIFEGGGADEHQKRLADIIFASDHVLVLFNLKELIDLHGMPGMGDRRVNVETAVDVAIRALSEAGRPFSVLLTQYDAYEALVRDQFGGDLLSAVKHYSMPLWRTLERCRPELLPVSSAETEDRFVNGAAGRFPAINAKPHPSVMGVAHAVNARLLKELKTATFRKKMAAALSSAASVIGIAHALNARLLEEWKNASFRKKAAAALFAAVAIAAGVGIWWNTPSCTPEGPSVDSISRKAGETVAIDLGGDVELELVWCPAGSFLMGSPADEAGRYSEETRHRVTLTRGFWLGKTEVTQGQWDAVMGYGLEEHARRVGATNQVAGVGAGYPMVHVSWEESMEFCRRLNARMPTGGEFRLPSEAEWEYACRAGTDAATYAGAMKIKGVHNAPVLDAVAWYGGNSSEGYAGIGWDTKGWRERQYTGGFAGYRKVGGRKPNGWGLHDMLGNVGEWCGDWYGAYSSEEVADPLGAASGAQRVYRGGSWFAVARACRSACRFRDTPSNRSAYFGFRVARAQP